jgi:hypothetical protein
VSVQDRWMVRAKRTTCLEIILDAHDGSKGDVAQVEACVGSFGDSANLDARGVLGLR